MILLIHIVGAGAAVITGITSIRVAKSYAINAFRIFAIVEFLTGTLLFVNSGNIKSYCTSLALYLFFIIFVEVMYRRSGKLVEAKG